VGEDKHSGLQKCSRQGFGRDERRSWKRGRQLCARYLAGIDERKPVFPKYYDARVSLCVSGPS
jgi:hypothetical protein